MKTSHKPLTPPFSHHLTPTIPQNQCINKVNEAIVTLIVVILRLQVYPNLQKIQEMSEILTSGFWKIIHHRKISGSIFAAKF